MIFRDTLTTSGIPTSGIPTSCFESFGTKNSVKQNSVKQNIKSSIKNSIKDSIKNSVKLGLLSSLAFLLTACVPNLDLFDSAPPVESVSLFSQTLDLQITQAQLTKLNPPGVNSSSVGATMNLYVGFDVLNGSENFVNLRDVDYTVYLSGYQVDGGRLSTERLGISEGGRQHFEFPINLNIQNNPELLNQALQILDGNTVQMRIRVKATTEDDLRQDLQAVSATTSSTTITTPNIQVVSIGLLNANQLSLKLEAENTGGVGYVLSSQRFTLRQNTLSVARGDIFNVQVPAQTTTGFEIILDLDNNFDTSLNIDVSSNWLFDVLGAGSFRFEDWFLRTRL